MRYNKEELIKIVKNYFEQDKTLQSIFACSDGNIFYSNRKSDAVHHRNMNDLKMYEIFKSDVYPENTKPVELEEPVKQAPIKDETPKVKRPRKNNK